MKQITSHLQKKTRKQIFALHLELTKIIKIVTWTISYCIRMMVYDLRVDKLNPKSIR